MRRYVTTYLRTDERLGAYAAERACTGGVVAQGLVCLKAKIALNWKAKLTAYAQDLDQADVGVASENGK